MRSISWLLCATLVGCSTPAGDPDAAPALDTGCAAGFSRCGTRCVDLGTDVDHCGACNTPSVCGACGHVCSPGDSCDAPLCTGTRQLVANSTFAVDLASWQVANNPVGAGDVLSTFRHNRNNDAENEPSTGPCARVLYQDVLIPATVVAVTFSAEVRSDNTEPLMPDAVTVIETRPFDGVSDAFRIDLVDPTADVFYAPILYTLFTTVDAVGTPATAHLVSVSDAALTTLLAERAGTLLRVRIAQVESNVPWHVDVDNVSLAVNITY